MSSLPRYADWLRSPHPFREDVGGSSYRGTAYISGRNHLMRTEGHRYKDLNPGGPDNGGDFQLKSHEYSQPIEENTYAPSADPLDLSMWPVIFGSFGSLWQGKLAAVSNDVGPLSGIWPELSSTNDINLSGVGTTAIARSIPTNPVADLATFIGELREGLPKLGVESFHSRTRSAKSAGGDYLNYNFGWKPLVSDLKKFAKAVTKQDEILRQYERNSGKVVKRKMTMTDDVSVSTEHWTAGPAPSLYFWIGVNVHPGVMTKTTTTTVKRWFSGAFTYYLEPEKSHSLLGKVWSQKANKLFGTRLTPEVVWNLTPWSWAADWVGNTGDVLHNIAAFAHDGLVMPYAYVMEEKSITHKYHLEGVTFSNTYYPGFPGLYSGPFKFEQSFTTRVKKRLAATPFGFGLNPDLDFSSRQQAIIAALGLTRGRRR